jgi:phenol 2-monooxygenase
LNTNRKSSSAVNYSNSVLIAKELDAKGQSDEVVHKQPLATGIIVGKRMPSFKVLNQSDARPWHLQELLKSNGRWRIIVFPGQLTAHENMQKMQRLGAKFKARDSFIRRYTPPEQSIDSVIEILTIHAGPRKELDLMDLPEAFHPFDHKLGWDYWKVYADDQSYHEGHGQAYANYGIDPVQGASIIVRPDQYVSWVGEVDDYDEMESFFSVFMKPQK